VQATQQPSIRSFAPPTLGLAAALAIAAVVAVSAVLTVLPRVGSLGQTGAAPAAGKIESLTPAELEAQYPAVSSTIVSQDERREQAPREIAKYRAPVFHARGTARHGSAGGSVATSGGGGTGSGGGLPKYK
jgi:uncharacterized membrane protein YgcG